MGHEGKALPRKINAHIEELGGAYSFLWLTEVPVRKCQVWGWGNRSVNYSLYKHKGPNSSSEAILRKNETNKQRKERNKERRGEAQHWWCALVIPVLDRSRQESVWELQACESSMFDEYQGSERVCLK